jgi:uncharacterized iron-regulated protein
MLQHFLGCSVLVLVLSGCAARPLAPEPSGALPPSVSGKHIQHTLIDVQTQRAIAFDTLVDAVAATDIVAIGEEHHQPDIQAFALRLLQDLAQRRPQHLALAMEFLERDQQPNVDAYLSGAIDQLILQNRLGASEVYARFLPPCVMPPAGTTSDRYESPRRIARQGPGKGWRKRCSI